MSYAISGSLISLIFSILSLLSQNQIIIDLLYVFIDLLYITSFAENVTCNICKQENKCDTYF